jgi:hypothetical protein
MTKRAAGIFRKKIQSSGPVRVSVGWRRPFVFLPHRSNQKLTMRLPRIAQIGCIVPSLPSRGRFVRPLLVNRDFVDYTDVIVLAAVCYDRHFILERNSYLAR